MTQALEVRALRFGYGRSESVHDVSLSLATGDCYGFLGHNGAGKTTVLRLCLGLLSPRSGSVHIHGIDALRSPREARALLGAMVERPGFHLQATALQNLASLARLQGMSRKIASTESWRVIELLSLKNAAGWPVGAFSLGMRQRLGIAQALLGKPRLLLLDEPTNGLDPEGIADLRALLRHLSRDEGTTVLLSSHQLQEIEGLCTRIGVLREGRMALEGNVEDLRREIPKRHIVQGTPMESMRARLIELGLAPISDGEQMLVDLGPRSAGTVARALTEIGELTAFSPESITLESIYLRATRIEEPVSTPKSSATQKAATTSDAQRIAVSPGFGTTKRPRFRAYRHEVHVLLRRPLTKVLLFLPAAFAAISVNTYRQQVGASLERVQAKEQFSADSGSGHLAVAHALLAAVPVLALCLLWLGSQSIAADLQRDTLRNSMTRSVTRGDVLFGKLLALATFALAGWATLAASAITTAALLLGLDDLEEITRNGGRQVLASAIDVSPILVQALLYCLPPLLAVAALGLCASSLARRPARALALALLLIALPETVRAALRDNAAWLLSSHLPTFLRDDSVLGYFEKLARGAADANWAWEQHALLTPLCWFVGAILIAFAALRQLRIP